MIRSILVIFVGLPIGYAIEILSKMPLKENVFLEISAALIIMALFLTGLILASKKETVKKEKDLEEDVVYAKVSTSIKGEYNIKKGVLRMVLNNKTKKFILVLFEKEPPPIFKKEDGEIVPYQ